MSEDPGPAELFAILWLSSAMFLSGYLKMSFWQGLLSILIWPYFLGQHFSP